jgi:hypothetical protein
MERFQIYLTDEQHDALLGIAAAEGRSVSAIVREAVDAFLPKPRRGPEPLARIEHHPLWKLIEMAEAEADPNAPTTYGSTTYKQDLYGGYRPL